jgi:hypothetical protein
LPTHLQLSSTAVAGSRSASEAIFAPGLRRGRLSPSHRIFRLAFRIIRSV